MENKKGFTLIELLAVIVILAIIALIATPIILNIIKTTKKSSSIDSAYGYIESIEYMNSMNQLDKEKYPTIESGNVTSINEKVNIKGTKPSKGNVTIENGIVTNAQLCINGYMIKYNGKNAEVINDKCEDDIQTPEVTYKSYAIGDEIQFDPGSGTVYTWNVIKNSDENESTVLLLMNQNLGEEVKWLSDGDSTSNNCTTIGQCNYLGAITVKNYLNSITNNWNRVKEKRLIKREEIYNIFATDVPNSDTSLFINDGHWLLSNLDVNSGYWTESYPTSYQSYAYKIGAISFSTGKYYYGLAFSSSYIRSYKDSYTYVRPVVKVEKELLES